MARETWATRIGFILAAVGSAVGLGNIWRFPFQVGQEGGAAFLLVYLLLVALIGLPAMLVEFVIGRRAERNPINAFQRIGYDNWSFIGVFGVLTGFVILSYYSVVAGWVLRYTGASVTGAYFGDPAGYFGSISAGMDAILFHALFLALAGIIVAFGIQRGIELSVQLMVPSIVLLLVGLAVYAVTLDGASAGYSYYLSPDFGYLAANIESILPAAAGQVLFTLSLGMGVMITYASYLGEDDNLAVDGLSIVLLNTFIGALAGLVIFPFLFTIGVEPGEGGAGALFVAIAGAFAEIPAGQIVGVFFFFVVAIAALSSAISIYEVIVSYLVDNFGTDRKIATAGVGIACFLAGIPAAMDTDTLGIYDTVAGQLLLPLGLLMLVLFVGWVYSEEAMTELSLGVSDVKSYDVAWLWHVRTVISLVIVVTLYLGIQELMGTFA
jgi:NSS family neurotransmitter:Na+ symporter